MAGREAVGSSIIIDERMSASHWRRGREPRISGTGPLVMDGDLWASMMHVGQECGPCG
jgi:hypothetical protein